MKTNLASLHLFTPDVMKAQLLQKWKWTSVEKYCGTTNPRVHVKTYLTQANIFSEDSLSDYLERTDFGMVLFSTKILY